MIDSRQMPPNRNVPNGRDRAPILRWAGSKRRLVPVLRTYWNKNHSRYLEPFAGSACLFFSLNPTRAILGDVNHELIATYLEVKYRVDGVIRELAKLRLSREQYNTLRALSPCRLDASARAARFIYLNRFCFNGLYRTNLEGRFNVPFSGERCGALPSSDHLKQCSRTLRHARLINADFECVLSKAERGESIV